MLAIVMPVSINFDTTSQLGKLLEMFSAKPRRKLPTAFITGLRASANGLSGSNLPSVDVNLLIIPSAFPSTAFTVFSLLLNMLTILSNPAEILLPIFSNTPVMPVPSELPNIPTNRSPKLKFFRVL